MTTILRQKDVKKFFKEKGYGLYNSHNLSFNKKIKESIPNNNVSKQDNRQKMYADKHWRLLSTTYRMEHPLSEIALLDDKVIPADAVHHIISPFSLRTEQLQYQLMYDKDNLISIDATNHGYIHGNNELLSDKVKQYLNERMLKMLVKYNFLLDTTKQFSGYKKKNANNFSDK